MERARGKETLPKNPPLWWHDAVRQNYEGNLYNPNKFISHVMESEEGDFTCCFISLTAPDMEKNLRPGIYLETDIPKDRRGEVSSMVYGVLNDFAGILIRHRNEKLTRRRSKRRKAGTEKISLGEETDVDGYLINVAGNITVLLAPAEAPKLPEQSERDILLDKWVKEIFAGKNEVRQIRLLYSPDIPDDVKKRHVLKDMLARDSEFNVYMDCGYVSFKDQIEMAKDAQLQGSFRKLLHRIRFFRTKAEEETLLNRILTMDHRTRTGWNFFLIHHWMDVFPDVLPNPEEDEDWGKD